MRDDTCQWCGDILMLDNSCCGGCQGAIDAFQEPVMEEEYDEESECM